MMEEIDGYQLLSLGFKNPRIKDPVNTLRELRSLKKDEIQVQLVKAGLVAGPEHLRFAARNALRSFHGKNPRSKSLAVEYLLYLSCQRQISKAITLLGVEPTDRKVILVGLSKSSEVLKELEKFSTTLFGEPDDSLVEIDSNGKLAEIQRSYGISKKELEAARFEGEPDDEVVKRLVVERSALLSIPD